jgi:hypothetical protein
MESVKVPQHLELEDVIAWGLGPTDLFCVVVGGVVASWLYLALPGEPVLRLSAAIPPAAVGVALGVLRTGERALREWLLIALAYALRPHVLVSGGWS